jgi:VanZ family protein
MHFICGIVIASVAVPLMGVYSVALVAVIALAKEIYDHANKSLHTSDVWDWVATALGGLVGFCLVGFM